MNFNEIIAARKERGRKVLHEFDENSFNAAEINKQLLKTILSDSKDTEYVRKYNFAGIKSVEDFKRMVPFTTYDDYEPYITRMIENGEKNLLTANPNDKETNFLIVVLKNYYIYSFIDY